MGNPGGPSRGCKNCKRSHVKCDEAHPACSLCVRRKLSCGYKSNFDLFLVDQTVSVRENWGKKRRKARYKTTKQESDLMIKRSPGSDEVEPSILMQYPSEQRKASSQMCSPGNPGNLALNIEQFALAFWFSRYFDLNLDKASPQGFLELQPQLYARAKPNSTLERATCALAYLSCSFNLEAEGVKYPFFLMSRMLFGDAMRLLKEAIQDPEESTSDEILMAGMILNMLEAIMALVDHRTPSKAHLSGAIALIKLRGPKNFSTPAAQRMLTGVHSELVGIALHNSVPVQQILAEASSASWIEGMKALTTHSARLPYHAEQVANVQAAVRFTLDSWDLLEEERASELLALLFKADQDLLAWEQELPQDFHPTRAADLSVANLKRFEAYGTCMDTYADISVADTQNSFRILRIMLQLLIRDILHRITIDRPSALPFGPTSHSHTIQRLVDEVCASVPFYMGTKRVDVRPEEVDFPHAPGHPLTETQRANNLRLGTCFVFAPLQTCARCPDLRPGQREWIQRQTDRLESLQFRSRGAEGPFFGWQTNLRVLLRHGRLEDDKSLGIERLLMKARMVSPFSTLSPSPDSI